jgi:hypothetical protein
MLQLQQPKKTQTKINGRVIDLSCIKEMDPEMISFLNSAIAKQKSAVVSASIILNNTENKLKEIEFFYSEIKKLPLKQDESLDTKIVNVSSDFIDSTIPVTDEDQNANLVTMSVPMKLKTALAFIELNPNFRIEEVV